MDEATKRAIDAMGGPGRLGEALGITGQAVGQWNAVPPRRVLDVERISGVPRHELRPDLYPPPAEDKGRCGKGGAEVVAK